MKPAELEHLLDELCVKHGVCLPPEKQDSLRAQTPDRTETFVSELLSLEGLSATSLDNAVYRGICETVSVAFERADRRGDV